MSYCSPPLFILWNINFKLQSCCKVCTEVTWAAPPTSYWAHLSIKMNTWKYVIRKVKNDRNHVWDKFIWGVFWVFSLAHVLPDDTGGETLMAHTVAHHQGEGQVGFTLLERCLYTVRHTGSVVYWVVGSSCDGVMSWEVKQCAKLKEHTTTFCIRLYCTFLMKGEEFDCLSAFSFIWWDDKKNCKRRQVLFLSEF